MARLKKNSTVKTVLGESVTVLEKLGEGGQGIVYKVIVLITALLPLRALP